MLIVLFQSNRMCHRNYIWWHSQIRLPLILKVKLYQSGSAGADVEEGELLGELLGLELGLPREGQLVSVAKAGPASTEHLSLLLQAFYFV